LSLSYHGAVGRDEAGTHDSGAGDLLRGRTDEASAIVLTDREGTILFVNAAWTKLTGYAPEEVIGQNPRILKSGVHGPEFYRSLWRTILSGRVWHADLVNRRRDGSHYLEEETIAPLLNAAGEITHFIGIKRDVTGRRAAEDVLREAEQRYRELVEASQDLIITHDLAGGIQTANATVSQLLGYPVEELVAMNLRSLVVSSQAFEDYLSDLCRYGGDSGTILLTTAWGGTCAMEFRTRLRNSGFNGPFARMVAKDVTDRHLAEQARERSEARLRLALKAANQGLYDLNVLTGDAKVSAEYATMLGYDPADFHETNDAWIERLHPDDKAATVAAYQDYIADRIPEYHVEFRQRTRGGEWIWVLSLGSIVERDAEGRPVRMLGTHTDVTARKRAELERENLRLQLEQAQKIESIGRLAGGVAHDFNNMLSVIMGHIELARNALPATHSVQEDLQQVWDAAERSAKLTRQLLGFSRRQTIAPRILDLNATLEGMLGMLRPVIGEDIDLVWNPAPGLWPVKLDPSQIDQILVNLCVNSRDAIDGVGRLVIETANATVDESYCATHLGAAPGDYAVLIVSDDGCGMEKEVLRHAFEPFYTTKPEGQGTGLGLATVYGIVKQNDGFINVYSEPGNGTTFRIYLPRREGRVETKVVAERSVAEGGSETVLVVEDESAIRQLAQTMLERLGYTVLAAGTPDEALELARTFEGRIDLLITDVVMPGMNGRELADRLTAVRPDTRCLFMSGYTADVIAHRGKLYDGVHFVQKPFTRTVLAASVRDAVTGPRHGTEDGCAGDLTELR